MSIRSLYFAFLTWTSMLLAAAFAPLVALAWVEALLP